MELGTAMSFALLVTTSHYDITAIKLYLEVGMISKLFCEIIEASESPRCQERKQSMVWIRVKWPWSWKTLMTRDKFIVQ